jgi:DNA-binding transcriptional LysR family regulator
MHDLFARGGISFERLRSFLTVLEAGSLPLAAPGNRIRQSQLGRQIAELEAFFGIKLLERSGKTFDLTAAGKHLAYVGRDFLAGLSEVSMKTADAPVELSVGAGDSVIRWWIAPRKEAFGGAHVTVTMMSGAEVVDGLVDAKLDVGIVRRTDLRKGLLSAEIGTIDYALYVAKELLPKGRTISVKEMLQTLPIGVLTGEPSFSRQLEAALEREKVRLDPAWVCDTFPQLCDAVAGGWCAAVLPTLARDELPAAKFGEYRDAILGKHEGRMYLAWTPRLERQRPRAHALIKGLVKGMQRQ